MRRLFFIAVLGFTLGAVAFGVEPPSPQEFGNPIVVDAVAPWWGVLVGDGFWAVVIGGILGAVYKVLRPVLLSWLHQHRLGQLFVIVETGVSGFKATLTDKYKQAGGGKLTPSQAAEIKAACKVYILHFAATQGIDVLREYGDDVINILIEWMLEKIKKEGGTAGTIVANLGRVVAPPLPELGS